MTTLSDAINCIQNINVNNEKAFLYEISQDIYKLDMPPINSIFLIKSQCRWYLIDAGKSEDDVNKFIISAFRKLNINYMDISGILITHSHWDHVDGLPTLLQLCPNAKAYAYRQLPNIDKQRFKSVSENCIIDNLFKVVTIFGHSDDSLGFIDMRSHTLFSGDAIQLYGISTCGIYIFNGVDTYLRSLKKLQTLKIHNILASHPYVPNGAFAFGEKQSQNHIKVSLDCIYELIEFTKQMLSKDVTKVGVIKAEFIGEKTKHYFDFPTDGFDDAIESIIETNV